MHVKWNFMFYKDFLETSKFYLNRILVITIILPFPAHVKQFILWRIFPLECAHFLHFMNNDKNLHFQTTQTDKFVKKRFPVS